MHILFTTSQQLGPAIIKNIIPKTANSLLILFILPFYRRCRYIDIELLNEYNFYILSFR